MPSAFISYAHEDQEFMLALAEQLRRQELDIRYDGVVLNVGDSLIDKISQEIADGDFLIAIVSPDSVASNWCRHELSLAATQGVNQARVKVLPVKFREAAMPPILGDIFYANADKHAVETIARQLAAAMQAHLGGADEAEAAREAEEVEEGEGRPAHAEVAGDAAVALIEDVVQRAMDVFDAWTGLWRRGGNIADLYDPQRRLRWTLDVLPDRTREALPIVTLLSASQDHGIFQEDALDDIERDVRQELLAVRRRVAQGLPVARRWMVVADEGQVSAGRRHAVAYLWRIQRGQEARPIVVYVSRTAMDSDDRGLPEEVAAAKNSHGRSVLSTIVGLDDPPDAVMVTTAGISLTLPD